LVGRVFHKNGHAGCKPGLFRFEMSRFLFRICSRFVVFTAPFFIPTIVYSQASSGQISSVAVDSVDDEKKCKTALAKDVLEAAPKSERFNLVFTQIVKGVSDGVSCRDMSSIRIEADEEWFYEENGLSGKFIVHAAYGFFFLTKDANIFVRDHKGWQPLWGTQGYTIKQLTDLKRRIGAEEKDFVSKKKHFVIIDNAYNNDGPMVAHKAFKAMYPVVSKKESKLIDIAFDANPSEFNWPMGEMHYLRAKDLVDDLLAAFNSKRELSRAILSFSIFEKALVKASKLRRILVEKVFSKKDLNVSEFLGSEYIKIKKYFVAPVGRYLVTYFYSERKRELELASNYERAIASDSTFIPQLLSEASVQRFQDVTYVSLLGKVWAIDSRQGGKSLVGEANYVGVNSSYRPVFLINYRNRTTIEVRELESPNKPGVCFTLNFSPMDGFWTYKLSDSKLEVFDRITKQKDTLNSTTCPS